MTASDHDLTMAAIETGTLKKIVLLKPGSKKPEVDDASGSWLMSDDIQVIDRHLERGAGIGRTCCAESGRAVIDIDDVAAFNRMQQALGSLGRPWVKSRRGFHYDIPWEPDLPPVLSWEQRRVGEILRGGATGDGKQQAVCPPSLHPDSGQPYEWLVDPRTEPLAPLPEAWRRYLHGGAPGAKSNRTRIPVEDARLAMLRGRAVAQPGARWRRDGSVKFGCPACLSAGTDQEHDNARLAADGSWGCAGAAGTEWARTHWEAIRAVLDPPTVTAPPTEPTPWLAPRPIPDDLPAVPAFDATRLLPPALMPWVVDIAERSQAPVDYIAIAALAAASSVIGRQMAIRPKQHDDWTVVPNLWGLAVGRAGLMKSPAMAEALKPLHRLVAHAREAQQAAMRDYEFASERAKLQKEALKARLKEAVKAGRPTDDIKAAYPALEEPETPAERRYIVNDATVEKLGELLEVNRNGLLIFRDELAGWLSVMDREGHENDRAFYCEAWNGTGSYTYDRIERGTVVIEAACVAILGGIQPGPLAAYLREVFGDGHQDDGLIQRFQLLVWPDVSPDWENVDRWPSREARDRAWDVFRHLAELPREVGAMVDDFGGLPFLRFSFAAQATFDAWREQTFEPMLRAESDDSPVVLSHLAKYRSLVPSLALIFHLIDCVDGHARGAVTPEALDRALAWLPYLEAHARRVYHGVTARSASVTQTLAKKIKAGRLTSPFLARTILRCGWSGLTDLKDIYAGIDSLVDLHWLRREDVPTTVRGGRPTVQYHINPAIASVSSVDFPIPAGSEDTRKEEEEGGSYHVARARAYTDSPAGIRKSTDITDPTIENQSASMGESTDITTETPEGEQWKF
jgi:putative DNA primase/helicase